MSLDMLAPERCLLTVVDVQNDFCHEKGAYAQLGHRVDMAAAVVPNIEKVLGLARLAGIPTVFVRGAHSEWTDEPAWVQRGSAGSVVDMDRVPVVRAGTWGADYYRLEPQPDELELIKHRYSAFAYTPLELIMRAKHASTIVITGVSTPVCVHSTARDALFAGFVPVVVEEGTAAHSVEGHEQALADIRNFIGHVVTLGDLEETWQG